MLYCILSLVLFVFDVRAINKIHRSGSLRELPPRGFDTLINEYNITEAVSVFNDFNLKYGNRYENNAEKAKIFNVFRDNLRKINHLNQMAKTATFMMNEFTSMTLEDFTEKYTGYNSAAAGVSNENVTRFDFDPKFLYSENKDYREGGLLMVKHQKNCGNSYVHSAVGNIEAQYDRKYKLHTVLSEQHAFDCEPLGSCSKGGVPHHVFEYLGKKGGLMQLIHYPAAPDYRKHVCLTDPEKIFVRFNRYARFDIENERILAAAVDTLGPLCATIFVSESVKNYKSGILDPKDCNKKPTNHAILLMGYGSEDGIPYWIVKNSWGFDWGEGGYLRLIRGKSACGIGTEYVATVILSDNYNSESVLAAYRTIAVTGYSEEDRRRENDEKYVDQGHKPFNCSKESGGNENGNDEIMSTTTTTTIATTTTTTIQKPTIFPYAQNNEAKALLRHVLVVYTLNEG